MIRTVNFISGGGSTNLAVLEAQEPGGKLFGHVKTVALISSDIEAPGFQKAIDFGFPLAHTHVVDINSQENLTDQLLSILSGYEPDYCHQLGWLPLMPMEVLQHYKGLNQHLGPGGKWMYGERRIYAHMRFCEMIGEKLPIPIFCQKVAPKYDTGDVIYVRYENLIDGETVEMATQRLLPIEHEVQIEALRLLDTNQFAPLPVPVIARNPKEEELLLVAKKEARDKYSKK